MTSTQQRNILVTGAAGGIGTGLCTHFADRGARVLALDVDEAGLAALAARRPGLVHPTVVDLLDAAAVAAAVSAFADAHGPVDVLINNAGAAAATALANLTPEAWRQDLDINLTAAYHCVEAVKPAMIARGAGVIVNIGSVNAFHALGHPAYSAAKAGLISYTRALAVEYGPLGIRANIICPGTVRTQAWNARAERNPDIFTALRKWYPLRDFPDPSDIAAAAEFLASDAARMITGVVLPVDAGLTAGNPVMAAELTLERF
ncbi:SDR family oxidoreductase [Sphingomonas flavalba]|uniref:SDR family oxidoreductase n=1 Tax=Sphingomonas flavalba TaxID=2559804 RepID=UPI00109DF01A|nr:SDR family oxidoreductase [Sphingomonas flavalba]